jgi:hypothetical protein
MHDSGANGGQDPSTILNSAWLASQTTMSDRVLAIIALISVIADHYLRQRGQVGDNPAWPFAPPAR